MYFTPNFTFKVAVISVKVFPKIQPNIGMDNSTLIVEYLYKVIKKLKKRPFNRKHGVYMCRY